jgi:hypothetical protein
VRYQAALRPVFPQPVKNNQGVLSNKLAEDATPSFFSSPASWLFAFLALPWDYGFHTQVLAKAYPQ